MKKVIICAALFVAAICFTSCDKKEKCWKVVYKFGESSLTVYDYGTREEMEASYGKYDDVTYKSAGNLSETNCALKNLGLTTTD